MPSHYVPVLGEDYCYVCQRCQKPWLDENDEWSVRMVDDFIVGVYCGACQTVEEFTEREVNETFRIDGP